MQKDQQKELGVSLKISNLFLGTYKINEKITDYTFTDKETVLSDSSTDTSFYTFQDINITTTGTAIGFVIGKENTNRYRFDIFQTSTPQLDIMIFKENGSSWTRNTLYKNQQKCVVFEALIDENTYHLESYQNIHFNEDRTISYPQLNTFDKMVRAGFSFLISEQFRTSLIGDKFETTQMTDDGRTYNVNVSGESFTVIFSYEL